MIGGAYGGSMKIIVNCDIVVASSDARLCFPEVKRGFMLYPHQPVLVDPRVMTLIKPEVDGRRIEVVIQL